MPDWAVWMVIAAGLAVGEVFTLSFFLGPIALAAVAAGVVGALGLGLVWQLIVFILASIGSLAILRPIAVSHLKAPQQLRTGTAALVGTRGIVLERIDHTGGQVKIGGEVWTARPFFDGQVLEPGARVEVAKIEGATALVYE